MGFGSGNAYGMNQTVFGIHADVGFHAEVPGMIVALHRQCCRLTGAVLCRLNTVLPLQTVGWLTVMLLQQMPKFQNGRFIRHDIFSQLKPGKSAMS